MNLSLKLDHVLPDLDAALYEDDESVTVYREAEDLSTGISQKPKGRTQHSKNAGNKETTAASQTVSNLSLMLSWPWGKESLSKNMIIGRDRSFSSLAPQLTPYKDISRIHAQIRLMNGEFYLYDLYSTNGTFVEDKRISADEPVRLQKGAQVRFARDLKVTIEEIQGA